MQTKTIANPWWTTSSFGDATATAARDLGALGEHLDVCLARGSRLFPVACGAEALHRFVASRFVTTLALAALLIGAGLLAN